MQCRSTAVSVSRNDGFIGRERAQVDHDLVVRRLHDVRFHRCPRDGRLRLDDIDLFDRWGRWRDARHDGTTVMGPLKDRHQRRHARWNQKQQEHGDIERERAGTGGDAGDIETRNGIAVERMSVLQHHDPPPLVALHDR